ncbi:MAG: hypothetical protein IJM24_08405 [Clostridia bacterium]|nr:hypothetical protein [Clostridia bacterium]
MKKCRLIAILLVAVMLVGVFAACGGGRDRRIVGKWIEVNEDGDKTGVTFSFARNGKGTYGEDEFSGDLTWSTSKGVITMTVSLCGQSQTREYRYIISGRTLTLIDVDDPDDVTILKKK